MNHTAYILEPSWGIRSVDEENSPIIFQSYFAEFKDVLIHNGLLRRKSYIITHNE